jgi:transposase
MTAFTNHLATIARPAKSAKRATKKAQTPGYDTDITDAQWQRIEPLLTQKPKIKAGRPRIYPLRDIVNAILYIQKAGCQWRMIPKDFPNWQLVWKYFSKWRDNGILEEIRIALNKEVRIKHGKNPTPSVLIADSQSVKTAQKGGIEDLMVVN